jgi:hypothetical protein
MYNAIVNHKIICLPFENIYFINYDIYYKGSIDINSISLSYKIYLN